MVSSVNQYKQRFFLPVGIYLLNHSVGCLPRKTAQDKEQFFDLWKSQGGEAWECWLSGVNAFCHSLSNLLKGRPDEFCPQTNVSSAISKILLSLPLRKGRTKLLLSDMDFPSMGFIISQMERLGYHIDFLTSHQGTHCLETWEQRLTEDVQLVFITHVIYGNSFLNPVAEILRYAKKRGVITVVDIAQSAGVVPIDLRDWDADFVVGSSIKWLCGGPGAAFLWGNSERIGNFQPIDVGWFSHENPFEFDIHNFRYAKTSKRFWGGTPSVLPFLIARSGIDLINSFGIDKIRVHNQRLTKSLIQAAIAHELAVHTPLESSQRGGTVAIGFKDTLKTYQRFKQEKVFVDMRPSFGLRFSPHIYNDEEELEKVIALMKPGD